MTNVSDNLRGALLMMGSMAAFTVNDAFLKALAEELPMFQAIFLRGVLTSLFLALFAWWVGGLRFSMSARDWWLVTARGVSEVAAAYFFITALINMPFANVSAVLQVLPLSVTLIGALLFREAIGWRRLLAILVGFLGVLLIIKPGAEGFNAYSIYAVIAVLCVTIRDLTARPVSRDVPSMTIALIAAVMVTGAAGLASIGEEWARPTSLAWLHLSGAVFFIIMAYVFSVMTMRVGDISAVAPFRYVSLLAALIIGFLFFGEWPDNLTLLGAFIIVATGVFTIYRERAAGPVQKRMPLRMR